jgi:hypothetical protein
MSSVSCPVQGWVDITASPLEGDRLWHAAAAAAVSCSGCIASNQSSRNCDADSGDLTATGLRCCCRCCCCLQHFSSAAYCRGGMASLPMSILHTHNQVTQTSHVCKSAPLLRGQVNWPRAWWWWSQRQPGVTPMGHVCCNTIWYPTIESSAFRLPSMVRMPAPGHGSLEPARSLSVFC